MGYLCKLLFREVVELSKSAQAIVSGLGYPTSLHYMVHSVAEDITTLAGGYSNTDTNLNRLGNFLLAVFIVLDGAV